jgi:hypothetical protein
MADNGSPTGHPISAPPGTLQIVLFGIPDAGKSSLLGALAQSAQTQEHLLNGHLSDLSRGLGELQRRLYEGMPRGTAAEVMPYPVSFEEFTQPPATRLRPVQAILFDCDGRAANELLSRRNKLDDNSVPLARAVAGADALILAVDCSAPPSQVDADFGEFSRFLQLLEHRRGRHAEVAGLPVFLVLTKCDLLAQPKDTPAEWMERIENKKREVDHRFRDFLARDKTVSHRGFGRIELHLWATAVKHPALEEAPARPRDPYGVAELFRQCLQAARCFQQSERKARSRLAWTVTGTGALILVLTTLAAILIGGRQREPARALEESVQAYRAQEGSTAAQRFRGPLQRKLGTLRDIQEDPDFGKLDPDDQNFVNDRIKEIEEYVAWDDRLQHIRLSDIHDESQLEQLESRLRNGDLAWPSADETAWQQTEAGRERMRTLKQVEALKQVLSEVENWYRRLIRQGQQLRTFANGKPSDAPSWTEWQNQVGELLGKTLPHSDGENITGTNVTYGAMMMRFQAVVEARRDFDAVRHDLGQLRDLTRALGLAGRLPDGERQPLDIPEHFPTSQAGANLHRLDVLYPRLREDLPSISLPDVVVGEIRNAARVAYDHLIQGGRDTVLDHLQQSSTDDKESAAGWRQVRLWLANPDDLRDWRPLATLLARLKDPEAADPVSTLAAFLGRERFVIDLQRLTLELPFDRGLRPSGPLTIYHGRPGSEAAPALIFRLAEEEPQRDAQRRITTYHWLKQSGSEIVFRPGDSFFADVPVKREDSGADGTLAWSQSRSAFYQIECLQRAPQLQARRQDSSHSESVEDVTLTMFPADYPVVPDLLPAIKQDKR